MHHAGAHYKIRQAHTVHSLGSFTSPLVQRRVHAPLARVCVLHCNLVRGDVTEVGVHACLLHYTEAQTSRPAAAALPRCVSLRAAGRCAGADPVAQGEEGGR